MSRACICGLLAVGMALWVAAEARCAPPVGPGASGGSGQIVLKQLELGPAPTNLGDLSITPDGQHVALAATVGTRRVVYIDGNAGQPYSSLVPAPASGHGEMAPRLIQFSPDGMLAAYIATKDPGQALVVVNQKEGPAFARIETAQFAPAGHRLVYVGIKPNPIPQQPGAAVVVDNGVAGPEMALVRGSDLWFSADGQHMGYLAEARNNPPAWEAVVDGKPSPAFSGAKDLRLSPAGGRYAFIATPPGNDATRNFMVVDGRADPVLAQIRPAIFSDDGAHVAYVGAKAVNGMAKWIAVVDGQAGPDFDQISFLKFSADGKHVAYSGMLAGKTYAVVDGKKSLDYRDCQGFVFSPDSQHLAYVATASNGRMTVVADGREQDAHEMIQPESVKFSNDGRRLAYIAQDQGHQNLIVDSKPGPVVGAVDLRTFRFSPDGQHYSYKTRNSMGQFSVVTDTQPPPEPGKAGPSDTVLTSDWKHSAQVMPSGSVGSTSAGQVMLDGKPVGGTYGDIQQLQLSDDGGHVAYSGAGPSASGKTMIHSIIDGRDCGGYFRIDKIALSPDGKHIATAATSDGTKHFCALDSFQGPEYDDVIVGVTPNLEGMQFQPDGSLSYLAVKNGKLNRIVVGPESFAALPSAGSTSPGSAPGYTQIHEFGSVEHDGTKPTVLTAAPDGTLYGATTGAGEFRYGVIFKTKPDGTAYQVLHSFEGGQTDGAYPNAIFVGPDGSVYGSLMIQGPSGSGAIFKMSTDGSKYAIIHPFDSNTEGAEPVLMSMEKDGTMFGATNMRRPRTHLFQMTPDGTFKTIYETKPGPASKDTIGPMSDGGDGYFYGVASDTLFKIKKDGSDYATVHKFTGGPRDTSQPDRVPAFGPDKTIYGAASNGGKSNGGVFYKLSRDGSNYAVIMNPDEPLRPAAMAMGPDGKLYALVQKGIISFNPDGSDMKVAYATDGGSFAQSLVLQGNALYGMNGSGGSKGNGVVFRYGIGGSGAGGGPTAEPTVVIQNTPPPPLAG